MKGVLRIQAFKARVRPIAKLHMTPGVAKVDSMVGEVEGLTCDGEAEVGRVHAAVVALIGAVRGLLDGDRHELVHESHDLDVGGGGDEDGGRVDEGLLSAI